MAKVFNVEKSAYYKSFKDDDIKSIENKLEKEIIVIFNKNKSRYGIRRVTYELNKFRINKVNHKKVARIMNKLDLKAKAKKKFKNTTNSNHKFPVAENLLNREFKVDKINKVWTSDITYIKTDEGWLYLTVVIDLFSRKIIGYSMDDNMKTGMVLEALKMAYLAREPKEPVMFHSDRGVQYASHNFTKKLKEYNMIQSMSRKGNCWDNAPSESFFHTLKVEEVYYKEKYRTRKEARDCIFEYINVFYNRQRCHSYLKYLAPEQFELNYKCGLMA